MAKPKTQFDQRRSLVAKDQYGRPWTVNIELATGDPCGIIIAAGWDDPLEQTYLHLRIPRDAYGTQQWGSIEVQWEPWITDTVGYEQAYRTRFIEVGRDMNKGTFDPEKWAKNPYLIDLVGPKPWPSSEVLRMAKAGHQELLNLVPMTKVGRKLLGRETLDELEEAAFVASTPEIPPTASAVVGSASVPKPAKPRKASKYNAFVSAALSSGDAKNISEAAALWREQKAGR